MCFRARWLGAALVVLGAAPAFASTVIGLSVEDQARLARFVVVGHVESLQAAEHREHGIETEVSFVVSEALKGSLAPGQVIVFHTHQGDVAGARSVAPGEARFSVGQKALVFIEDVDGRLYNLGLSMGVWDVQERDGAVVGFTRALVDGLQVVGETEVELGPIPHGDMVSRVEWAVRNPEIEHPLLRSVYARGR